jgi:hypothetical protein
MELAFNLASSTNTTNPCLFVLRKKGYGLEIIDTGERCFYIAMKGESHRFVGDSAPELLGLVTLWEELGDCWMEMIPTMPDIVGDVIVESPEEGDND